MVAAARNGDVTGLRIGVVKELGGEGYQPGVEARFHEAVELLTKLGAEVVEVSCPHFQYALPAYYLILPSEASSNLAKFDAMRFGLRVGDDGTNSAEKVMSLTREAGFGAEVKRRIMLGTHALSSGYYDAYYGQAQKVRTLIAARLRQRLRAGRRAGLARDADHGVRDRRPDGRPDRHVQERPVHDPVQPGRQRGRRRSRAAWPTRTACRSAST